MRNPRRFHYYLIAAMAIASMGNAGGRAAVSGEGNVGAPGEPSRLCFTCHNGGSYGPIIELLEITTQDGQLTATYEPGVTYNVRLTLAANAGTPAGYGFQLTALNDANANAGTFNNLGANVKEVTATNPNGRKYLEHKGGTSATNVFTAKWVAPAKGSGDVTFYYIGSVVNGNGAQTGDNSGLGSSYTMFEGGPGGLPLPYFEDFEFGDGGWMSYDDPAAQNPSSWQWGAPQGGSFSGANAWVTDLGGSYQGGEYSYLETPALDFSSATVDPVIEFAIRYDTDSAAGSWVEVSTDGGQGWQKVGAVDSDWYNGTSAQWGDWWSGDSGGWQSHHALLPNTAGLADVRVRLVFVSDSAGVLEGVAVDDFIIDEALNAYYDEPEPEPDPEPIPDPDPESIPDPPTP